MNDPSQQRAALLLAGIALVATAASFAMLVRLARRLRRGEPILPRQPRRPVPWGLAGVLLVAGGYVALWAAAHALEGALFGPPASPTAEALSSPPRASPALRGPAPPAAAGPEHASEAVGAGRPPKQSPDVNHPLIRLIRQRPHWTTLAGALLVAVLIAPVVEEFLFRLLLQGWLESLETRLRHFWALGQYAEGALPVLLVSAAFAALHYREAEPPAQAEALAREVGCHAVASLATLLFGLACLRGFSGATLEDLGVRPAMIGSDIRLGLGAFLTVAAPMYGVQIALSLILPALVSKPIAPDPITLGLFAMLLGTLYSRTHRIVPAITLHMALNATSVLLAWFTMPLWEG